MPSIANRNKIYIVSVICFGFVVSIWLIQRTPIIKSSEKNLETVSVNQYRNIEKNDDWKKILVTVDSSATDTSLVSRNNTASVALEDSTLTDQMSRDFLSQYLLAVKNNGAVSSGDAEIIAQNTLSLPEYTESSGAQYVSTNLKISTKTDNDTLRIYRNRLYKILKDRSSNIKDDPIVIVINSMTSEDDRDLAKLDYIINQSRGLLKDLLTLEVPRNTIQLHLSLVNSVSDVMANLESMRLVLGDPVRGLAGIGAYTQNIQEFQAVLEKINKYFALNL